MHGLIADGNILGINILNFLKTKTDLSVRCESKDN